MWLSPDSMIVSSSKYCLGRSICAAKVGSAGDDFRFSMPYIAAIAKKVRGTRPQRVQAADRSAGAVARTTFGRTYQG